MKITYKVNSDVDAPCCAMTEIDGNCHLSLGKTWEHARQRLIEKVSSMRRVSPVPPPEEIEI